MMIAAVQYTLYIMQAIYLENGNQSSNRKITLLDFPGVFVAFYVYISEQNHNTSEAIHRVC